MAIVCFDNKELFEEITVTQLATDFQHWTPQEIDHLPQLLSYSAALQIALAKLKNLPQPVVQVCGPMTTGGKGSLEENLKAFHQAITWLADRGEVVFDQRPFGPLFGRLCQQNGPGYDLRLLDQFYLPIFESGLVKRLYFLPGWQTSRGTKWERRQAFRLRIPVSYLPEFQEPS